MSEFAEGPTPTEILEYAKAAMPAIDEFCMPDTAPDAKEAL